jgi:hypothetical protein
MTVLQHERTEVDKHEYKIVKCIYGMLYRSVASLHTPTDKPKFINCTGPQVSAAVHQTDVRLSCDVQAQPPITDAWIRWARSRSTSGDVKTLAAGKRDGHYHVELRPHNPVSCTPLLFRAIKKCIT